MLLNKRIVLILMLCSFFSCQYFNSAKKNDKVYFDKVIEKGKIMLDTDVPKAIIYVDTSFKNINKPDPIIKAKLNHFKAIVYFNGNADIKKGKPYIDSAINYAKSEHDMYPTDVCEIYILKAKILIEEKKLNEALKYYYITKKIAEKSNNTKVAADVNASLGNILFLQKKFSLAIIYFIEAKKIYSATVSTNIDDNFIPTYQMLNNIGICYEREKNYHKAIKTYSSAINFISSKEALTATKAKNFVNLSKSVIYGNLGSAYLKNGEYVKAEYWIKKSLQNNPKSDDKDYNFNRIKLANLYILSNRSSEAKSIIEEVDDYYKFSPNDEIKVRLLELKKNYYDAIKDDQKAYLNYKAYHNLKDSLNGENEIYNIDFIKEFDKLEKDNELKSLKIKDTEKSFYLIITAGMSLFSVLTIFLILKNSKINKRHVKDLTILNHEISKHNKVMQKTLQALEQSQAENSYVMQVLAHDMRTPIAGIKGLTDFLLAGGELNEEQIEIVTMINISSNDSLNFINDLLQSQTNKINLFKESVDLSSLINYCVILLKAKAQEKNIRLNTDMTPIEVIINREKVWRVMSNLISNAIKFSKNGSTVNINIKKQTSSVLITIKDEGIGIPETFANKIFDMSAEIKRQGTDGEKSYGLGLAISKQIIEAHNGKIWFKTQVGVGTEFFVELPLAKELNDIQQ